MGASPMVSPSPMAARGGGGTLRPRAHRLPLVPAATLLFCSPRVLNIACMRLRGTANRLCPHQSAKAGAGAGSGEDAEARAAEPRQLSALSPDQLLRLKGNLESVRVPALYTFTSCGA